MPTLTKKQASSLNFFRTAAIFTLLAFLICFSVSCKSSATTPPPGTIPPPAVSTITLTGEDTPIYHDYAAQTFARDMVEVRGRVDGYVEQRLFEVGADVKAGQPLYKLDRRPYSAEVDKASGELEQAQANQEFARRQVLLLQAEADLAEVKANRVKAQQEVKRLQPLVKERAASQQDLDNAVAALEAADANVKAKEANVEQNRLATKAQIDTTKAQVSTAQATLRSAQLNLGYATIDAPISGRIGDSLIQIGGLVSRNSAQPLTTIVPLDTIWVRFQMSEAEYLDFEKRKGGPQFRKTPLELVLADNSTHPFPGRIENTANTVDPKTGTLEIQATFPNPHHTILPGQFGRVRMRVEDHKNALLVPQRSIQELQGLQSVLTVGPDNKVQARSVVLGERVGERAEVLQGLKEGDQVIVEGIQKARPGTPVTPEPWHPDPATPKPSPTAAGGK
jgi:membrane fusion protein (multidrug efflux system)